MGQRVRACVQRGSSSAWTFRHEQWCVVHSAATAQHITALHSTIAGTSRACIRRAYFAHCVNRISAIHDQVTNKLKHNTGAGFDLFYEMLVDPYSVTHLLPHSLILSFILFSPPRLLHSAAAPTLCSFAYTAFLGLLALLSLLSPFSLPALLTLASAASTIYLNGCQLVVVST